MECPQCGKPVDAGQRFCTSCGTSLGGVTDATQVVDEIDETAEVDPVVTDTNGSDWVEHDPVWAATAGVRATVLPPPGPTTASTQDLPSTEPITEVRMEPVADALPDPTPPDPTPYDFTDDEPVAPSPATTAMPVAPTSTAEMPATIVSGPDHHFRFAATTLISVVAAIVTLVAVFANIVSITSNVRVIPDDDTPVDFATGTWILDDLADNLSIAGLIAAVLMAIGGIAAGFRWRWGAGLAAGAGLAFAGVAAIGLGLAQLPIDAAHGFAAIPNEQEFTLTITRDLGYWLLVIAGAIGIVLFFASINDALGDRRSGLNPWIAALGALATVIAVAGPLIPEHLAAFSDNWYLSDGPGDPPALLLAARFVQLGLLLFTGVVGFLMVRRYGIGLAIGGALPLTWMAVSVLFDLTDRPVGPAYRNPGAIDMHLHGVTIIGISAIVGMAVLAAIAAYDQGVRERT